MSMAITAVDALANNIAMPPFLCQPLLCQPLLFHEDPISMATNAVKAVPSGS